VRLTRQVKNVRLFLPVLFVTRLPTFLPDPMYLNPRRDYSDRLRMLCNEIARRHPPLSADEFECEAHPGRVVRLVYKQAEWAGQHFDIVRRHVQRCLPLLIISLTVVQRL
jgi:hypothetical protein